MALKALMLRKKIDLKKKERSALEEQRKKLLTREAELEKAIDEVTNEEEEKAVQEDVDKLTQEKDELTKQENGLDETIKQLETELAETEAAQDTTPPTSEPTPAAESGERSKKKMNNLERSHAQARDRVFGNMTRTEQTEMIQRDDVKAFLASVRDAMQSKSTKRSINNIGLTIPEVFLGLLRQNVILSSKLYKHVTVSNISGEGRILVAGDVPEAVWTDCCANLNELDMTFYQDSFGCWKLGGYFVVCNANLEDSDLDLAAEVLSTLAQSLGFTDDKTIIFGTGVNMPQGIVTRLAQESQPAGYAPTARPWVDLHTTNIKTIADTYTGLALFQQLVLAAGAAKNKYSRGDKVWVMNEFTHNYLMAQAMSIDASGAITSGINGTMPVIGGMIEILPDSIMPDYNILMGYYDLYRLIERAGEKFASSEEYFFLSDQTVFKATVRWDGKPIIAEGFVLIGINGTAPTTTATFKGDGANEPTAVLLPATATVVAGQKVQLRPSVLPYGVNTTFTWKSGTTAKATVSATGEVTGVAAGDSVITVTTDNGLTAQCTVTVTAS